MAYNNEIEEVKEIETATDFLQKIKMAYRDYKPGMYEYIRQALSSVSAAKLNDLYNVVLKNHFKDSAPNYAELCKLAFSHGISLKVYDGSLSLFHCKQCGALYPISDYVPIKCSGRIDGQICGYDEFDTKVLRPGDNQYSYYQGEQRKMLKKEREELKKRQIEHFNC